MEHGAVMPYIPLIHRQSRGCDVVYQPANTIRRGPEPGLREFDCSQGNIKDCEMLVPPRQKIVNQCGLATSDVNNSAARLGRSPFNIGKRCFKMRTIPTDLIGRLRAVDTLPVLLGVHQLHSPAWGTPRLSVSKPHGFPARPFQS